MPRGGKTSGSFTEGDDPRRGHGCPKGTGAGEPRKGGNTNLDSNTSVQAKTLFVHPLAVRPKKGEAWYPTEERLDLIYQLALCGNSEDSIARIGCATDEGGLLDLIGLYPDIAEIIKDGRAAGEAIAAEIIVSSMMNPENKGRVQSAQFYLKARRGWSETIKLKADIPLPGHAALKDLTNDDLDKLLDESN
jgi:hypothetical protein